MEKAEKMKNLDKFRNIPCLVLFAGFSYLIYCSAFTPVMYSKGFYYGRCINISCECLFFMLFLDAIYIAWVLSGITEKAAGKIAEKITEKAAGKITEKITEKIAENIAEKSSAEKQRVCAGMICTCICVGVLALSFIWMHAHKENAAWVTAETDIASGIADTFHQLYMERAQAFEDEDNLNPVVRELYAKPWFISSDLEEDMLGDIRTYYHKDSITVEDSEGNIIHYCDDEEKY